MKCILWGFFCVFALNAFSQTENSLHSWLPDQGGTTRPNTGKTHARAENFLSGLNGTIRPMACTYSGSTLVSKERFANGRAVLGASEWQSQVNASTVDKDGNTLDFRYVFSVDKGQISSAGVAVAFDFTGWSTDNYLLVPAMIYGGNRFRILPIGYPPYIHDKEQRPLDMPITTTNILHLNKDGSHAKIEMTTGNMATPMFSFYNPDKKEGLIILTDQGTAFGNNGMFIEEDAGPGVKNKRISLVVSAPGVREEKYVMCGRAPSGDKGADFSVGDSVTLRFRLIRFKAPGMVAFYEKVSECRKELSGKNGYACVTPFSEAANLILAHHNAHKWFENDKTALYCNRPGNPNPYGYQIGWGGAPLLSLQDAIGADQERLRRVCLTLSYVFEQSQSPTGLFYAINREGEIFGDAHGKMKERPSIAMTRRGMDVLNFGIQYLDLLKRQGHADLIKAQWEKSLRSCADALVAVWNRYGQFGQFINVESGVMDINGSTAGCAIGSALALASVHFGEPQYLAVAEAATKMYYERDFLKGYAGGGAAEILQSPDSEAPWDMAESCMDLYDITGKQEWLDRAKFAVNMLSTWMVSYDYRFPEKSAMRKAGVHAAGSIFASSQNNHSAPGYYILSGDFMLKLFRATGDSRYAEMYKDQTHNVVQYVGAPYNPIHKPDGYVTERVQLSDWEGKDEGSVNYGDSNMSWETLAALSCMENPGIYLHTDDSTFLVLDHVEARVIKREKGKVTLSIHNPTPYDASVTIFAETSSQAKVALPLNTFMNWPKVAVKAGQQVTVEAGPDGKVAPE